MKLFQKLLTVATVLVLSTGVSLAEEMKDMQFPQPGPENQWLQQLVGEWETDMEAYMEPGKPPVKSSGTETVRSIGGFWVTAENKSTMMDMPFTGMMTLGYDASKKKYIGTWVDSMTGHMWQYEGTVDPQGKALTLEAEGPCPMKPGKVFKFKETMELKDNNTRTFTSMMQGEDGQWTTMMVGNSRRINK